jgi:hypothetical protein
MTVELVLVLDAMLAMVAETEVERLRMYLEVSQATLEAVEREIPGHLGSTGGRGQPGSR